MKPFRISNYKHQNQLWWFSWLAVGLGGVYFYLAFNTYFIENDQSATLINLILGLVWVVSAYVHQFWHPVSIPDIILNDAGVTVEEDDKSRLIHWKNIQNINVDNNTLAILLDNGEHEELKIWGVEYKELQMLKNKLRKFTDTHNISYSSKY